MIRKACAAPLFVVALFAAPALAASNPWLGTWRLKLSAPGQKPETLIYSDAGSGAMRMVSVEDRSEMVTHFDGMPAPDTGAGAVHQYALAITATSSTSYSWTLFKEGKPWVRGRNVLAVDHGSFKEVSWLIAKPKQKLKAIYERQ